MSRVARPWRDGQQVRGQRAAVVRVQVRGRLVQDEQRRVGQQRPGQRDPLPLAAGHGGAAGADRGVPALRQRLDPGQQPGPRGRLGQLVSWLAPGRASRMFSRMVVSNRCGSCGAAADHGAHLVGAVAGQVGAAQRGRAAGQVAEPQQHGGHRGLARPAGADQGDPPPGRQVEVHAVEGQRPARLVAHLGAAQRHPQRPGGQRAAAWPARRTGSGASSTARHPGRRWPGPGRAGWRPRAARSPPRRRPARSA